MNQDPVRVQQVHWTRVFPSLRLFEAGPLGCGLSTLMLAYLCLLLSWTGSTLLLWTFSGSVSDQAIGYSTTSYGLRLQWVGPSSFWKLQPLLPPPVNGLRDAAAGTFLDRNSLGLLTAARPPLWAYAWYVSPVLLVWNALVMGLFGTAMARTVATEFCRQASSGAVESARYGCRHWNSTLLSTGLALAFPAGLTAIIAITSLIPRMGAFGEVLANGVWGIVLLLSVVLALICLTGGLAWLLSLAAIGTDGCTGAEALSRCISYLLSHPFWSAGALFLVSITSLTIRWIVEVVLAAGVVAMPSSYLRLEPGSMIHGWLFFIRMVPHAFHLAVFTAGITVCYVLLRQREDGISVEELDGAM